MYHQEHILPVSQGSKVFLQCTGRCVSRAYSTRVTRQSKCFYSVQKDVYHQEHILPVSQGSKVFLQCAGRCVSSRVYPTCITRLSLVLTVCILEGLWASPLNISCVLVFTQKISLWSTHPSLKPDPCLCWDHLIRIKCCRLGSLQCFSLSIVDDHVLLIKGFELVPE